MIAPFALIKDGVAVQGSMCEELPQNYANTTNYPAATHRHAADGWRHVVAATIPPGHVRKMGTQVLTYNAGQDEVIETVETWTLADEETAHKSAAAEQELRAFALVALGEINALRSWLASFKTEVAAAASLADLKTRVATLPAMPQRTSKQMVTAIAEKL